MNEKFANHEFEERHRERTVLEKIEAKYQECLEYKKIFKIKDTWEKVIDQGIVVRVIILIRKGEKSILVDPILFENILLFIMFLQKTDINLCFLTLVYQYKAILTQTQITLPC